MRDPRLIVREGYDSISGEYRSGSFDFENSGYGPLVTEFETYVPAGGQVLDLGCGCGVPVAKHLAERYRVIGVDLSPVQLARAEQYVPGASFICADMAAVDFEAHSFDAIVSFFALIHLPLEEQPQLFRNMARWLTPGGHLLVTVGGAEWTGTEPDWHGAEMYWSHAGPETYRGWLEALGFEILVERVIPEGKGGHPVFIARKLQDGP